MRKSITLFSAIMVPLAIAVAGHGGSPNHTFPARTGSSYDDRADNARCEGPRG